MGIAALGRQQYLTALEGQLEVQEGLLLYNIQVATTSSARLAMSMNQVGGTQQQFVLAKIVQLSQILAKMEMEMKRIQVLKTAVEADKKAAEKGVQSWAESFKTFA